MKWGRILFLVAATAVIVPADELHLRDGTVILGAYVGGTQKEIYFQHTPAGSDMFPLFLVESLKFNSGPGVPPELAPGASSLHPGANPSARLTDFWPARVKWMLALLFPPPLAAQPSHPAH